MQEVCRAEPAGRPWPCSLSFQWVYRALCVLLHSLLPEDPGSARPSAGYLGMPGHWGTVQGTADPGQHTGVEGLAGGLRTRRRKLTSVSVLGDGLGWGLRSPMMRNRLLGHQHGDIRVGNRQGLRGPCHVETSACWPSAFCHLPFGVDPWALSLAGQETLGPTMEPDPPQWPLSVLLWSRFTSFSNAAAGPGVALSSNPAPAPGPGSPPTLCLQEHREVGGFWFSWKVCLFPGAPGASQFYSLEARGEVRCVSPLLRL